MALNYELYSLTVSHEYTCKLAINDECIVQLLVISFCLGVEDGREEEFVCRNYKKKKDT